ncbi:hypothetical protein CCM_00359 [Cordyceps militaris CM01]|uniref:Uncharacterized protein n=1 Tax=Cordyceps militaris (strain CM01) TaxID=983644 RepID=G3J3M9_CORMM|nr:uncharacterized protein CCM_00359 [Cordyceps militaris CM01]EGX95705.1 hypothetical protein CCM_00359 [Cordyceps militaris CM01]
MTPRTRSGGAAPPASIVYKSTPTLKQVQFPARRKRLRTYGKRNRRSGGGGGGVDDDDNKENEEGNNTRPTPHLKQKTLTQYDFASSFAEDSVVELSDASDVENLDKGKHKNEGEKENNPITITEQEDDEEELVVLDTEAEQDEAEAEAEEEDEDEGPVVRGRRAVGFTDAGKKKRRRTLGEEHRMSTMKGSTSSRRRTLGDSPAAGPSRTRYHTQTLTQCIGRTTSFVADSDDEALGSTEDDGFLDWLGQQEEGEEQSGPQSPTIGTQASKRAAAAAAAASPQVWEDRTPSPRARSSNSQRPAPQTTSQAPPREESIVPQTPVRSIRFGLPPSTQPNVASPSPTRLAALYGAISQYTSPSSQRRQHESPAAAAKPLLELTGKPRRRISPAKTQPELVIADSYATEGWSSVGGTQARRGTTPSQTQKTDVFSTPAEESAPPPPPAAVASTQAADKMPETAEDTATAAQILLETQSQDGQIEEQFYGALSQAVQDSAAVSQQPPLPLSPATPRQAAAPSQPSPVEEAIVISDTEEREIPDSDDEEEDFGAESDDTSDHNSDDSDEAEESRFAAGAETQLLMDQLQSSSPRTVLIRRVPPSASHFESRAGALTRIRRDAAPGTVANDIPLTPLPSTPLRTPLHHPHPIDTQGVPFESQRVAVATLQNFPPASARTDILLPVSAGTLAPLIAGRQDVLVLPFKVPVQVARFWLLGEGGILRYLACIDGHEHDPERDNGRGGRGTWSYRAAQVYELNNPACEDDMRAEDWIHGRVTRYVYFPPAVVSQLLWNLRHPLFADLKDDVDDDDGAAMVTTPAAATALSSSSPLRRSARLLSTPARLRSPPRNSPSPLRRAHQRPPPSTMPAPPRPPRAGSARKHHTQQPFVRPSQATTVSQASTVAPPSQAAAGASPIPRSAGDESSESLVFDDHGGSSISMPYSGVSGLDHLAASQLLTGSQILPESLVRDEEEQEHMPEVIFDSEED